jgi:hypothetical protein
MNDSMSNNSENNSFWPHRAIDWINLIGQCILIIGGLGAVYQYFDVKQENRVKETMAQLQVFNSDPLLATRLKLGNVWESYQAPLSQLNQHAVKSDQDKARIQATIVMPIIHQYQLRRDIDSLVDFFDNLSICIQNRICDGKVARAFLGSYAQSFYELHQPWIKQQRETTPHYANYLEAFVNLPKKECKQ